MTPQQLSAIKARVLALADHWLDERARLLYWRKVHEQDRIDRGNHLPSWDWPPRERRARAKWTS